MKLCTSTNILNFNLDKPYQVPMAEAVKACAKAGYRYIDANLCGASRPGQEMARDDWEDWIRGIRELADRLGVQFIQAHSFWSIGNIMTEDGKLQEGDRSEELMRRSVLCAEILGVKWMVVHPYTVKQESWYSYKKSFACNREYYKRWGDEFARHGVGMAIENLGKSKYCACAEELLELIGEIGNPMVQICIDTGHAHLSGINPADLIRKIGPHLKATHIADNHQNRDEHFAPFNGTIDWPEVMKALREIGYEEAFAFEIHHLTSMYPSAVQQNLVNFSYDLGNYLLQLS